MAGIEERSAASPRRTGSPSVTPAGWACARSPAVTARRTDNKTGGESVETRFFAKERGAGRHQFLGDLLRYPHQAMNNQTPMAVWRAGMDKIEAAARAVDMPLRLDNANALPTYPQQKQ